jgi:hypothetical protein
VNLALGPLDTDPRVGRPMLEEVTTSGRMGLYVLSRKGRDLRERVLADPGEHGAALGPGYQNTLARWHL